MLRSLILALLAINFSYAEVELGCTIDPFPARGDGQCPPDTSIVKDGCCPDADTFIVTTPGPTTSPTTTAPCKDKINPATGVSDCPNRIYLCTDPTYKKVMKDQCPKSCGYCSSGPTLTPPKCSDKINPNTGTSDCPAKKYLCQDPTYKGLMKDQCPKTCGYC